MANNLTSLLKIVAVAFLITNISSCSHQFELEDRPSLIEQAESVRRNCTFVDDDEYASNATPCFASYARLTDSLERLAEAGEAQGGLPTRTITAAARAANIAVNYESFQEFEAVATVRSSIIKIVTMASPPVHLDDRYFAAR